MAIEAVTAVAKPQAGPTINDKPSEIVTLTAQQLRTSNCRPGLVKTINLAYKASEQKSLGASQGDRLGSVDELILVLRDDPESFIIILTQPHEPEEVVSTATCRRYLGPPSDAATNPWACSHSPADGTEEWELKLLATHPSAQGKGIASYMLALAEREVMERSHAKSAAMINGSGQANASTKVRMILCTPKPLYGKFYAGRRYQEDYIKIREKPDVSYEITFMSKVLVP